MTTKVLIFKVARFNNEKQKKDLQSLLVEALGKRKTAMSRLQEADTDKQFRLINYHGPHRILRVGEFIDYTQGQKQPVARRDKKAETLDISAIAPPGADSEFLHSILYFGVWKNCVIMSQSMSLKSGQFEEYLNWLLNDTGLLKEGNFVILSDPLPLESEEKVKNAKSIEFHAPVSLQPVERKEEKRPNVSGTTSIAFRPGNIGWDALRSILPPEIRLPSEFSEKEIIPNRSLEVTLKLSWSRLQKGDPTDLMDSVSNQLRHIDTEVDYVINTRSGKITRDDIKLRLPVSVSTTTDGLIRRSDMWAKMGEWLDRLLDDERVIGDM